MMKNKNFFFFRTSADSFFEDSYWLGFHEFKEKKEDWIKQVQKIEHYGFSKILMLPPLSERDLRAYELIKERDVTFLMNVAQYEKNLMSSRKAQHKILIVISNQEDLQRYHRLSHSSSCLTQILLIPHRGFIPPYESFKDVLHKVFFYLPLKRTLGDGLLSTRQINKYALKLKEYAFDLSPMPGLYLFEARAPIDIEFFPLLKPILEKRENDLVRDTIIIPVFNQVKELANTLEALCRQKCAEPFEVIVVDDGSYDGLTGKYEEILSTFQSLEYIDICILRNYRVHPRKMGDNRFRAGISRNIGLSFARGENIHFLDADVLVPSDYLEKVKLELQEHDVVQLKRYDLSLKGNGANISKWEEVDWNRDIDLHFNPYWYNFFQEKKNWNELECPWKYICTYGLSMKKNLLEEVGPIRHNYIFYGLEDTDIGLALYNQGVSFHLSEVVAYHQYHANERSEFGNSRYRRSHVLSQSAPVFFHNHLSSMIYYELGNFVFPHYSITQWLKYFLIWPFTLKRSVLKRS